MTKREQRLMNALRFIELCPSIYYGRPQAEVLESMKVTARMTRDAELAKTRKKAA